MYEMPASEVFEESPTNPTYGEVFLANSPDFDPTQPPEDSADITQSASQGQDGLSAISQRRYQLNGYIAQQAIAA